MPTGNKRKIEKFNIMKKILILYINDTIQRAKRQSTEEKKIFANHVFNKEFTSEIYTVVKMVE